MGGCCSNSCQNVFDNLTDDLMMIIFFHLGTIELDTMQQTCNHFYTLTKDHTKPWMDKYWEIQSRHILIDMSRDYNPNESQWFDFYKQLRKWLYEFDNDYKTNSQEFIKYHYSINENGKTRSLGQSLRQVTFKELVFRHAGGKFVSRIPGSVILDVCSFDYEMIFEMFLKSDSKYLEAIRSIKYETSYQDILNSDLTQIDINTKYARTWYESHKEKGVTALYWAFCKGNFGNPSIKIINYLLSFQQLDLDWSDFGMYSVYIHARMHS